MSEGPDRLTRNIEAPGCGDKSDGAGSIDVGGHVGNLHFLKDGAPRYELRIDREGRWFHEGIEIAREDIRNYFSRNLVRDDNGGYRIRIGDDECAVIVEDAPFVVVRVEASPEIKKLSLLLNDGGRVSLEPLTLEFNRSHIPYCRVRGGLEARFSRPAYYQLSEFIERDEKNNRFRLVFNGEVVELDTA